MKLAGKTPSISPVLRNIHNQILRHGVSKKDNSLFLIVGGHTSTKTLAGLEGSTLLTVTSGYSEHMSCNSRDGLVVVSLPFA